MDKSGVFDTTAAEYGVDSVDTPVGEKEGTVGDIKSMQRLGKEQLFKVRPAPKTPLLYAPRHA